MNSFLKFGQATEIKYLIAIRSVFIENGLYTFTIIVSVAGNVHLRRVDTVHFPASLIRFIYSTLDESQVCMLSGLSQIVNVGLIINTWRRFYIRSLGACRRKPFFPISTLLQEN